MAFSATIISPMKGAERISRNMGIYSGKVSINTYSQTLVTLTGITRQFVPTANAMTGGFAHGICTVNIDGPSSNGYLVKWDYTTGAFRCYYADKATTGTIIMAASATVSALGGVFISTASGVVGHTGTATTVALTPTVAAAASEVAADVDIGTFGFIAIGFVRA